MSHSKIQDREARQRVQTDASMKIPPQLQWIDTGVLQGLSCCQHCTSFRLIAYPVIMPWSEEFCPLCAILLPVKSNCRLPPAPPPSPGRERRQLPASVGEAVTNTLSFLIHPKIPEQSFTLNEVIMLGWSLSGHFHSPADFTFSACTHYSAPVLF